MDQNLMRYVVHARTFKNIDPDYAAECLFIARDIAYHLGWKSIERFDCIYDYDAEEKPPFSVRVLGLDYHYNRGIFDFMKAVNAEIEPEEDDYTEEEFARLIDLEIMEDQLAWDSFKSKLNLAL